jgi:transcription antitermination factor NusG
VARIIQVHDQRKMHSELNNIRFALSRGAVVSRYAGLIKGTRVEVRAGPLRGLQGIIEDGTTAGRMVLQVDMLGTGAIVQIDAALLDLLV